MKLDKYDNKRVRINSYGNTYEGIAMYNSLDYSEHEFGRREDALQLGCTIFYKSDIDKIEVIDDYSSPYGKLEEEVFEDGPLLIDEILSSEENEYVYRMLLCIESHLDRIDEKILDMIKNVYKYNDDKEIKDKCKDIIGKVDN